MCTTAAPASAAARHSSAICSGVIGLAAPGDIGAPPVTAHVMIVSECRRILPEKGRGGYRPVAKRLLGGLSGTSCATRIYRPHRARPAWKRATRTSILSTKSQRIAHRAGEYHTIDVTVSPGGNSSKNQLRPISHDKTALVYHRRSVPSLRDRREYSEHHAISLPAVCAERMSRKLTIARAANSVRGNSCIRR